VFVAAFLQTSALPAFADDPALAHLIADSEEWTIGTSLYLDVTLNGSPSGQLVHFDERGGELYASTSSLRQLGFVLPPETRPKLARDAYTFLHLPMVIGIVLLALGLKKVLEYVGDTEHHHLDDPLKGVGLYALFVGVALYLLGHVGFKRRTVHLWSVSRLITAALVLIAIPLVMTIPALAQLAVLAALLAVLVAFEAVRFAQERDELKHG